MGQFEQLDQLLETQDGMLRTAQVVSAGISKPVFYDYVHSRELERVAHGIYLCKLNFNYTNAGRILCSPSILLLSRA